MNDSNLRIGHGFDVHRYSETFDARKPLMLAGCHIREPRSLLAHSDGDVVLHAVCDAILGAIGEGDIGMHFPDTEARFAGADSSKLLAEVLALAAAKGFRPVNVDVTVIAQVPKLAEYRQAMTARLATLLGLAAGRVNLKATTTERLGYIGREEGIACHCVLLLQTDE